jgi:hypothetical protein
VRGRTAQATVARPQMMQPVPTIWRGRGERVDATPRRAAQWGEGEMGGRGGEWRGGEGRKRG